MGEAQEERWQANDFGQPSI